MPGTSHSTKSGSSKLTKTSSSGGELSQRGPPPHWNSKHNYHTPPEGRLSYFFWRIRLWLDVTFVPYMFEPWEMAILYAVYAFFLVFFIMGITLYLPKHLAFLQTRAKYYLIGE